MKQDVRTRFAFLIFISLVLYGCGGDLPTPKPVGYFRLDIPEPSYVQKNPDCPFRFEISQHSRLEFFADRGEYCWFDINYPQLNAKVHITYKPLKENLGGHIEHARSMVYEHQIKASGITSKVINRPYSKVYGLTYSLDGQVASPYQFYLTDSTGHFLRGSLYFEARPNPDSLQPALDYVKRDMEYFIDHFEWSEK